MIIHSYLTDGFFPWAELFVESFKFHNGEDIPMILCTRNLTEDQVDKLYSLHNNITIHNSHINLKKLAKKLGIGYEELLKHKRQIEKEHITRASLMWKQYTSADQRIRTIYEVMKENTHQDYMVHWDIDMYIRGKLDDLFNIVTTHDVSIRFRNKPREHRKVMGGLIGFKINDHVFKFMERWIKYLDDVPIPKRQVGYGQTSFYYAWRDLRKRYNWGHIPLDYISPLMRSEDKVWSANTKAGKTKNLKKCRRDFEKCKEQF